MQNIEKTKIKSGLLLSLTVMGALVVASSFSPIVFAHSMIDSKKDNIMTEIQAPKMLDSEKERLKQKDEERKNFDQNKVYKGTTIEGRELTKEQKDRFIQAAKDALKAKKIELPASGYKIVSQSISVDGIPTFVDINWYPESYNGDKPISFTASTVYHVQFSNVDLNKGTGKAVIAEVIEYKGDLLGDSTAGIQGAQQSGMPDNTIGAIAETGSLTKEQEDRFVRSAKDALKAQKIDLPASGYKIVSQSVTVNDGSTSVEIYWQPEKIDPAAPSNNKMYFVKFTNVHLDKGIGTVEIAKVIELGAPSMNGK